MSLAHPTLAERELAQQYFSLKHEIKQLLALLRPILGTLYLYVQPFERDRHWMHSPTAQENQQAYMSAVRQGDLILALKYRVPDQEPVFDQHRRIWRQLQLLREYHQQACAIGLALEWLSDFRKAVASRGPTAVYIHLVQLDAERPDNCTCHQAINPETDWHTSPWSAGLHPHHQLYNQAIWQIMASKPGMLEGVRRALQRDLSHPDEVRDQAVFGRHVLKSYGRELLGLVRRWPDETWFSQLAA